MGRSRLGGFFVDFFASRAWFGVVCLAVGMYVLMFAIGLLKLFGLLDGVFDCLPRWTLVFPRFILPAIIGSYFIALTKQHKK